MTMLNLGALYYTFGTFGKNNKMALNFRVSLDEKWKVN